MSFFYLYKDNKSSNRFEADNISDGETNWEEVTKVPIQYGRKDRKVKVIYPELRGDVNE